jgi:hypothetical protein
VYLYHLHHLYHHNLSESPDHGLHHDLISLWVKVKITLTRMADPAIVITLNLCRLKSISQKSVHHSPVDNPFEYEHHHMSNKIVLVAN